MRGPFSTPITPLPGSFFHADPQSRIRDLRLTGGDGRMRIALLEQGKLNKFLARMDVKLDEIVERERRLTFGEPSLAGIALIIVGGR